jgi:predicted transcriptional regulator
VRTAKPISRPVVAIGVSEPLYRCTARDLATADPQTPRADESVGTAATWLRTNGYDVAPVVDDNTPVGYVALEDLADAPSDDPVADHARAARDVLDTRS